MDVGFQRGRAPSTVFCHPQTRVRVVVHGDDFTFAATESELRKMRSRMRELYDVEVRGILGRGKTEEVLGGPKKGWSTKRVTNIASHCWEGWD